MLFHVPLDRHQKKFQCSEALAFTPFGAKGFIQVKLGHLGVVPFFRLTNPWSNVFVVQRTKPTWNSVSVCLFSDYEMRYLKKQFGIVTTSDEEEQAFGTELCVCACACVCVCVCERERERERERRACVRFSFPLCF